MSAPLRGFGGLHRKVRLEGASAWQSDLAAAGECEFILHAINYTINCTHGLLIVHDEVFERFFSNIQERIAQEIEQWKTFH